MVSVIVIAGLLALVGVHELVRWRVMRRGKPILAIVLAIAATYLGVAAVAATEAGCHGVGASRTPVIDHFAGGPYDAVTKLRRGDRILAADGNEVDINDLSTYVNKQAGADVRLTIERDGATQDITVKPTYNQKAKRWVLGFVMDVDHGNLSAGRAIALGLAYPAAHLGEIKDFYTSDADDSDVGGPKRILLEEAIHEMKRPMLSHALAWLAHFGSLLWLLLIPADAIRWMISRRRRSAASTHPA